jgi:tryptophanyl-tRNA synthetase
MIIDCLSAGLNPKLCNIFIQSAIPEHAELHLLLSMITPLAWLERVPTYKDQQEKLKEKDLSTYGFLGYPTLQAADILIYKAGFVPVGEDQVAHIELAREIARRFNYLYGREVDFIDKVEIAINKMGKKNAKLFRQLMKQYQEQGDLAALEQGHALLNAQANLSIGECERLYGFLEGYGKIILPEPEPLLTKVSKFPGLDGRKMSKSYNNTIGLTESAKSVEIKIRTMPTDPARVHRTDPGEPFKCPVWQFHDIYSNEEVKNWVLEGCRSAGIGCLECKNQLLDAMAKEQEPIRERAMEYEENISLVRNIVQEGIENARDIAKATLQEVRTAMGISY